MNKNFEFSPSETKRLWKKIIEDGDREFSIANSTKNKDADVWGVDGLVGARSYNLNFQSVMQDEMRTKARFTFVQWVKERKESGKSTHILEIFGSACFLSDFTHVDSITGVRLKNVDKRFTELYEEMGEREELNKWKKITLSPKRKIISGNVFNRLTWIKIKDVLKVKKTKKVDLIIVRPIGGIVTQVPSSELNLKQIYPYIQFFRKMYELLSSDGGIILFDLPRSFNPIFSDILEKLINIYDVEIDAEAPNIIKIKKTKKSRKKIPLSDFMK